MRFFTSDTHFGHERIISLCNRPFLNVEEMDEYMILRWNQTVGPDDTVFHLGDVAMGKIAETLPLVGRLNGKKILVPGNHDRIFSGEKEKQRDRFWPEYLKVFHMVLDEQEVIALPDGTKVVISHFPYEGDSQGKDRFVENRPFDHGWPLIHGHVHEAWRTKGRQFNVGVDVNDFAPVPESTIQEWAKTLVI